VAKPMEERAVARGGCQGELPELGFQVLGRGATVVSHRGGQQRDGGAASIAGGRQDRKGQLYHEGGGGEAEARGELGRRRPEGRWGGGCREEWHVRRKNVGVALSLLEWGLIF
jgi:hypothetical protein